MNQDVKENQVITAIDIIFQKGHNSKFSESFQKSVTKEAKIISVAALLYGVKLYIQSETGGTVNIWLSYWTCPKTGLVLFFVVLS